jgi:sphingomyelin phosphodiesterase
LINNRGYYNGKPTGTQWIAPSLTTFPDRNPSYRIFSADPTTYELLDFDQYRFYVYSTSDPAIPPEWVHAYSFKAEYNLTDIKPATLVDWAKRMQDDEEECTLYVRNRATDPKNHPVTHCDRACRLEATCEIMEATYQDQLICSGAKESKTNAFMNFVSGDWLYLDYN